MEVPARTKGLRLDIEIDGSTGVVIGDARRLRESLEHVIRNAIAYTDKGHVALSAWGDEEKAEIRVSDTGAGISPDDQAHVFERFTRIGGAHSEAALGLGLPLTRQFIEAHGGAVELQSQVGEGTTVTIVLPRKQP
jgi:signal transduction histidine kinase